MTRRGSAAKPVRLLDGVSVSYSPQHWTTFKSLRKRAAEILEALEPWKSSAQVHGSLARGDVDDKSDIDILLQDQISTQLVESSLEAHGFRILDREIAQATPMHSPKAHLYLELERKETVTVPLSSLRRLEIEFYKFGGAVSWSDLRDEVRRPGCTKKLTLIEPIPEGHVESGLVGRESEVARLLGISSDIVRERVRVLTRRDALGRTGVFLKISVPEGVSFEEALQQESRENPALRRTLKSRVSRR